MDTTLQINAPATFAAVTAHGATDLFFATGTSDLKLGYNRIRDEGAKALADALRVNGVLKTLDLYHNNIRAEGATAIAEALSDNGVLKSIDLRFNDLGDEGKGAIRDAVSGRVGFELEM